MDIGINNMLVYVLEVYTPYKWNKHLEHNELVEFFPIWVELHNRRLVWIIFKQNISTCAKAL